MRCLLPRSRKRTTPRRLAAEAERALVLDPASSEAQRDARDASVEVIDQGLYLAIQRGTIRSGLAASHTHDDEFHEIQLNGKQLVFLFMAATVVSVVIFLCGVLVGRNVRVEQRAVAQAAALNEVPAPDVSATPPVVAGSVRAGEDPTAAAPPPPADDLSYFDRLEKSTRSADDLKPTPGSGSAASATPSGAPASSAPSSSPLPDARRRLRQRQLRLRSRSPPRVLLLTTGCWRTAPQRRRRPSDGYAVQVAAVNVRGDADAIAKRLTSKGYAAYVQVPPNGTGVGVPCPHRDVQDPT